ncbi:hypothetical protein A5737_10755 [Mycobacterium colombiense]|nr:hypothetical protein A5737_10755 [Mycobacterium colombiense]
MVVVRDEGADEKRLVYVTGATDPDDIRAPLRQRLLTYVLPSAVVPLNALPLNPAAISTPVRSAERSPHRIDDRPPT